MKISSRPYMPGYGIQDEDAGAGLLPWEFVTERMSAARNYWLATARPDGRPHVTPVWGLWHEEGFYFGADKRAQKTQNLQANPAAVVHLESGDEAVILEGEALAVTEKELLKRLDAAYLNKYEVNLAGPAAIFGLKAHTAFAWREADFPTTATRWRISAD